MKVEKLAKLIEVIVRKVIREELGSVEKTQTNESVSNKHLDRKVNRQVKRKPAPKFSDNSLINSLLTETYDDDGWRNINGDGHFKSSDVHSFSKQSMASMIGYGNSHSLNNMTPTTDPEGNPIDVNLEGTAVGEALTRDYSELMKKINMKKGS